MWISISVCRHINAWSRIRAYPHVRIARRHNRKHTCMKTRACTCMHTCTHVHTRTYRLTQQDNLAHVCSDTCASTQAHIRPSVHAYTRAHRCTRSGEKFAAPCAHPKMHTGLCRASGGRFGALKFSASGSYPPPAICAPRTARWPPLHLESSSREFHFLVPRPIRIIITNIEFIPLASIECQRVSANVHSPAQCVCCQCWIARVVGIATSRITRSCAISSSA